MPPRTATSAPARSTTPQLPNLPEEDFIGEPAGRDTLNAIGLSAALIARRDPEAVMAVFSPDHLIEPASDFQDVVERAFALAEEQPEALITFGVPPRSPSTAYGYLELGTPFAASDARLVRRFRENPETSSEVPKGLGFSETTPVDRWGFRDKNAGNTSSAVVGPLGFALDREYRGKHDHGRYSLRAGSAASPVLARWSTN